MNDLPNWIDYIPNGSIFRWRSTSGYFSHTVYTMSRSKGFPSSWHLSYTSGFTHKHDEVEYPMHKFISAMRQGSTVNGMTMEDWEVFVPYGEGDELQLNMDLI